MTKQLDDMWSSKWVLPEHREAFFKDDRNLKKLVKPILDEQEIEAINQAIHGAVISKGTLILTLFSTYEVRIIRGTVLKFDAIFKMVKITLEDPYGTNDECEWAPLRDILKAELKEAEEWTQEQKDEYIDAGIADRDGISWE